MEFENSKSIANLSQLIVKLQFMRNKIRNCWVYIYAWIGWLFNFKVDLQEKKNKFRDVVRKLKFKYSLTNLQNISLNFIENRNLSVLYLI